MTRALKRYVVPLPLPEGPTRVDWLAGASLMMRRSVLDEIGLFDEGFFLYYEETDLCHRALRAGWPTVYVPDSRVTHIGSVSTGMKTWSRLPGYWFDSRWRYFAKTHGAAHAWAATAAFVLGRSLWRLRRMIERKPSDDPDRLLRDMIGHAFGRRLPGGGRGREAGSGPGPDSGQGTDPAPDPGPDPRPEPS